MAVLLGINTGAYTMYEYGNRSLPLAARNKLNKILQHFQDAGLPAATADKDLSQKRPLKQVAKMHRKSGALARAIDRAEVALENMRSKQQAYLNLTDAIQVLKSAAVGDAKELGRIKLSEEEVLLKLEAVGDGEQALAEYQLNLLKYQYHATLELAEKMGLLQKTG